VAAGYTLGVITATASLQIVHELASVPLRDSYAANTPSPSTSGAMLFFLVSLHYSCNDEGSFNACEREAAAKVDICPDAFFDGHAVKIWLYSTAHMSKACVSSYTADNKIPPKLAAGEELLVRCILIRAAYGGMAGDVTMLKAFALTWASRSVARLTTTCIAKLLMPVSVSHYIFCTARCMCL